MWVVPRSDLARIEHDRNRRTADIPTGSWSIDRERALAFSHDGQRTADWRRMAAKERWRKVEATMVWMD